MSSPTLRATLLRCEYRKDPLGIDARSPRLSWQVEELSPDLRNARQTAYQVQAASRRELLDSDGVGLWDSGVIASDNSLQVPYGGKALDSLQDVYWRVRVWDQNNTVSEWSYVARWSMGLLEDIDWTADWIEAPEYMDFARCEWIWAGDEPGAHEGARAGNVEFRQEVKLNAAVRCAGILLAATGPFSVQVDGVQIAESGEGEYGWNNAWSFDLTPHIPDKGTFAISIVVRHLVSGSPAGVTGKLSIKTADKRQQVVLLDDEWLAARVNDGQESDINSQYEPATVLAQVGETTPEGERCQPWDVPGRNDNLALHPVPLFQSTLNIDGGVKQARLVVCCLGICDVRLNGKLVEESYFNPGWCDYRHRVYYRVYDVTALVRGGVNVVTVALADGWYAGYVAWGRHRNRYGGSPKFCLQLNVTDEDGAETAFGTDERWRVTYSTPWREADLLMGETYDARLERQDDLLFELSDDIWKPVLVASRPSIKVEAHPGDPVCAQEELRPVQILEPHPGTYIFDMGQNMVGVVRLLAMGPPGTRITLRYAEVLQENGTLYTEAMRGARATDTYIKGSDEPEVWSPRFTFHGFRFVEVSGLASAPSLGMITGIVLQTALERTGYFSSSSTMVDQLFHNVVWGQKGNYLEVPTDCPQRDERAGWTGDAQIFIRTGSFNFDVGAFFTKWLVDLFDAQKDEGWFCCVAPEFDVSPNANICYMGWADAAIICPYTLYQIYGDTEVLRKYWSRMVKYMDYLEQSSDGLLRADAGFGDWVSLNAPTSVALVGTAYFAHDAQLMAEMAEVLGMSEEAVRFKGLFDQVRLAFQREYLLPDGRPKQVTQTAILLALRFNLFPPGARQRAVELLVQDINYRGGHFSTGFLGLKELLPALTEEGCHDLAVRVLLQEEFPSWGYEIRHGATTIWERWDGWNEELGLQTPAMNSFNHYAFGAVGEWLYMHLAGIDLTEPGYRGISIRPKTTELLQHVRAMYRSPCGNIVSQWWRENGVLHVSCRIPANVSARIHLPAGRNSVVLESGRAVGDVSALTVVERTNSELVISSGSGYYHFMTTER